MLNELRNEIGVGDIETYIQVLKATAGCEVIYDPKLTVHQMKKMGLLKNKKGRIRQFKAEDSPFLKIKSVQNDYEYEVKNFSYDPAIWFYMTPEMP